MGDTQTFFGKKIFTGTDWIENGAVTVTDGIVTEIKSNHPASVEQQNICHIIAPAFIDIQIYGAHEKLFSVFQDTDSLHKLYAYCLQGGASHFQPTVATNSYEVFYRCIDAVKKYWDEGGKGCIGLHIEGPWISEEKRGAHISSFIHSPSKEEVKELLEYGKGVITMITLAPEVCGREIVELIGSFGVIVSAGHSNAGYGEATQAFDAGITTATHLYNAMSALQHRAPGMVGAILDHTSAMCSIVPDGFHVDFAAVRIAKKIMGKRLFVITDAVTATTEGPYPHQRAGDKYESNGILSGSALDMSKSLRNLVNYVDIELREALRMLSLYPAQVMNLSDQLGTIEKGKQANLVLLDEGLHVVGTVV